MNRLFAQTLDRPVDVAHAVRRIDPSTDSRRVLDSAQALACVLRAGGSVFVAGTDERRSDVARMTAEFVHFVAGGAQGIDARSIAVDQVSAHGRPGDACILFARSTVDTAYRTTVDATRACGMASIALVPGVGLPDGRADHVLGVGGGGRDSFFTTYRVLSEIVHGLLVRDPIAA